MNKKTRKFAVISGGSGYLGTAIVAMLRREDYEVINIGKEESKDLEKIAIEIKERGEEVNVLIHAASIPISRKKVLEISADEIESELGVHVKLMWNLVKNFVPLMPSGSHILGISSRAVEPEEIHSPKGFYLPAKYALNGLLRVLSEELKDKGISVAAVAPAFMPGGLNSDMPLAVLNLLKKKSKPEDITNPLEVSEIILDILNNKIKNVNGSVISVPNTKLHLL